MAGGSGGRRRIWSEAVDYNTKKANLSSERGLYGKLPSVCATSTTPSTSVCQYLSNF